MKIVFAFLLVSMALAGSSGCRLFTYPPPPTTNPAAATGADESRDDSSLFADDRTSLSDKDLQQLITAPSLVPGDAKLAVLRAPSIFRSTAASKELAKLDEHLSDDLASKLKSNKRIGSITTMPSMLVPSPLTVAAAREAGARFQVNLVFVFKPTAQVFDADKSEDITGICKVAGAVVDTKNGTIPFALTVSEDFQAKRSGSDTAQSAAVSKAQLAAAKKAVDRLAAEAVKFLDSVP